MPNRVDIINSIINYLSMFWDVIFYIFVGASVQLFMIGRSKEKEGKKLSKTSALGIFLTAGVIGFVGWKTANNLGHSDWSGIVASLSAVFSLSIVTAINEKIPTIIDKFSEFIGGKKK